MYRLLLLSLSSLALLACAADSGQDSGDCEGDKCDEKGPSEGCGPVLDRSQIPENTIVVTMKMDANGRPVSQHTAFPYGDGSALSEYVAFDAEGRLEKELWTRYDEQGDVTTTPNFGYTYHYASGTLSQREVGENYVELTDYLYSAGGDLVETSTYNEDSPDELTLDSYDSSYDTNFDTLEVVETRKNGNATTTYTFDMLSAAEQPQSIRVGDSALNLDTTLPNDRSLISMTMTESFRDRTFIFDYDTVTGDFLVSANDGGEQPAFVVSYECAD